MRALIIEDESAAAQNLNSILGQIEPHITVVAVKESVVESVEFLSDHSSSIDLIFMDIHLADGDAFKIFERTEVSVPVIFTTAYDQYALQAFKVNSIDYILKPIKPLEVQHAIDKLCLLKGSDIPQYNATLNKVAQTHAALTRSFLVQVRDRIIPLKSSEIAFFYSSNDRVTVQTHTEGSFQLDKSLDTICSSLDPAEFFRANRQFIVARSAVKDASVWFGRRLALNLKCDSPEKIIIPKARTSEFKRWLTL